MSFTALHKPALYAIVQVLNKLILSQRVKIIKVNSACLGRKLDPGDKKWVNLLLIGHRPIYFLNV